MREINVKENKTYKTLELFRTGLRLNALSVQIERVQRQWRT